MFREMRRKNQLISKENTDDILYKGTSGVLALHGDEDYPYAVPISYVYDGERIYFHSAKSGHKIDAIKNESKASFCVINLDQVIPEEYTTYFRSVIAFGRVRLIDDIKEKRIALEKLAARYSPNLEQGRLEEIDKSLDRVEMIVFEIEHLSGKEAIELVNKKAK